MPQLFHLSLLQKDFLAVSLLNQCIEPGGHMIKLFIQPGKLRIGRFRNAHVKIAEPNAGKGKNQVGQRFVNIATYSV